MEDEIVEVTITRRKSDGRIIRERLNGEDAKKWNHFCEVVSNYSFIHGVYPNWKELNWESEVISDWS